MNTGIHSLLGTANERSNHTMQKRRFDWLIYPHVILFVWASLFCISFASDNGSFASLLAIGNIAFLLVNIPLGIFSIICVGKKRVGKHFSVALTILSILNILYGIAAWYFLGLLLKAP